MENRKRTSSAGRICIDIFAIGLLSLFSGFILGLIFAPQSGKNFRKYLIRRLKEIIDRSKFAIVEAKVIADSFLDKNREKQEEVNG